MPKHADIDAQLPNSHVGPSTATFLAEAVGSSESFYQQRVEQSTVRESQLRRVDRVTSYARGVVFLISVILFAAGYAQPETRPLWVLLGGAVFVAFIATVGYHEQVLRNLTRTRLLRKINLQQLARISRSWSQIPITHVDIPEHARAVAHDLDVFGKGSLFQLTCTAHTPLGMRLLRDWYVEPADVEKIAQRQQAVAELVPERSLREELILLGQLLSASLSGPEAFLGWAEGPAWLQPRRILTWLARVAPCVVVATTGLTLLGVVSPHVGFFIVLAALVLNITLSVVFTGHIHDIFNRITSRSRELQHYRALFGLIARMPRSSERLLRIDQRASETAGGALRQFKRLNRIMWLANFHRDALFGVPYIVLQIVLLWDFHVLTWVERWQHDVGHSARAWFDALAELEALASLAGLAADNPTWSFPVVQHDCETVQARGLGHPLLAERVRVANDVTVGPAGTVLLVTGSNMSGKSTLLRTLGTNIILAQSGAPVCAQQLTMPPLTVTTSIRIEDSLVDGVSLYLAELQRLKHIVDQATACAEGPTRRLFYLLDEVLQGTNSVERHIAVGRVISHLVSRGAMGAVSTHDLELARIEALANVCQTVYFCESFIEEDGKRKMTFDYKIRSGLATTTNALVLLEMVGLLPAASDDS